MIEIQFMNQNFFKIILIAILSLLLFGCSSLTNMGGIDEMITRTERIFIPELCVIQQSLMP
jgi:hypothetical protein